MSIETASLSWKESLVSKGYFRAGGILAIMGLFLNLQCIHPFIPQGTLHHITGITLISGGCLALVKAYNDDKNDRPFLMALIALYISIFALGYLGCRDINLFGDKGLSLLEGLLIFVGMATIAGEGKNRLQEEDLWSIERSKLDLLITI